MSGLLAAAVGYALEGFRVLALASGEKFPHPTLAPNGSSGATADPEQVARLWQQDPDANIGLVMGPGPEGAFVVAIDIDRERGGIESFSDLVAGRALPPTRRTRTPNGGVHLFFKTREALRGSKDKLGPG